MDYIQFLLGIAAIIYFAFMTILLKDTHRELEILERDTKESREEAKRMNLRLDGLYKILLDKVYSSKT